MVDNGDKIQDYGDLTEDLRLRIKKDRLSPAQIRTLKTRMAALGADPTHDKLKEMRERSKKACAKMEEDAQAIFAKTVAEAKDLRDSIIAPHTERYNAIVKHAETVKDSVIAEAIKAHDDIVRPAKAEYDAVLLPAKQACEAAIAKASEIYKNAVDAARKSTDEELTKYLKEKSKRYWEIVKAGGFHKGQPLLK